MQSKKGFLEISFGWLFAIIVGAVILFLAIFASVKLIRVGQYETSVGTQEEIEILLNPLETGFESGRISSFSLILATREELLVAKKLACRKKVLVAGPRKQEEHHSKINIFFRVTSPKGRSLFFSPDHLNFRLKFLI